jgi:hypothetical protein
MGHHEVTQFSQPVAGGMPPDQRVAQPLFQLAQTPVDGGLAGAERFGRRKRAVMADDRQEVSQVVPVKRVRVSHF